MEVVERRIGFLFAIFLVLLGLGAARATWMGVVRASDLKQAAATQQKRTIEVPARRGTITDRRGVELAVSEPASNVAANPYLIKEPQRVARRLAPLLSQPEDVLLRKLTKPRTGFVYLARKVPAVRARRAEKLEIEGLEFIPDARRVYPREWLASQLLGMIGTDNRGLAGLEQAQDAALRGKPGKRSLVNDARGEAVSLREIEPARQGSEVKLTIEAPIQDRAEAELAELGRKWKPKGATAIVMDPRDGSIMALANWPRVDANDVAGAPDYATQNRSVGSSYEPGSTFKAFTVAGALEDGAVTPETEFNLPPTITVADREIGESHPRGFETMDTSQILQKSSNVGAIKIGQKEGADRFDHWVRRFGFGEPTGIDLPGEEKGIILAREKYSGSSMGNLPIGQGLAVTPIQMATAYAAIANGGILRPPHVVAGVGGRPTPKPRGRRVLKPATSAALRRMLEGVVGPGGTASGAKIPGYLLAGKTGTANKVDPIYGGYSDTKYVGSFVGFATATHPRLLVTVMVDEPQNEIYGGLVAAPAWRDITSFSLNYLRIPPK
ncbi:MAG: penicillin-binding protein 2 [Solirubrobacterales bacterium]|nr:penicillin-binding protein 2 [Solirubrobacterales bacterium]